MTSPMERVQLGVRVEKNLVKVLKGLAEFNDETLGELLERIVLHSFDPVPGDEGESCASPHSRRQLATVETLRSMYGVSSDHTPLGRSIATQARNGQLSKPRLTPLRHPAPCRPVPLKERLLATGSPIQVAPHMQSGRSGDRGS